MSAGMDMEMHASALPALDWNAFFTQWQLRPVWTGLIVLAGVGYLLGRRRLHERGLPGPGPARAAAFVAGLLLLAWALSSAVGVYADSVFWMHMVQHLTLIMVVPALLVVGHPLTVLDGVTRGRAGRVLRSWPIALLTHPLVGFGLYAGVIVGTHLTGFMDSMMTTSGLASTEHLLYLGAGYLFLLPLLGDEPIRWHPPQLLRVFLLVVGMIPDTVVGIVLLQTNRNLFPTMLGPGRPWAPDPVQDLHIGGGLMWAAGDGLMMLLGVGVVVALIAAPGRRNDMLGSWLEGVRRDTMAHHVTEAGGAQDPIGTDADVDDDDAVLAAYNDMLGRMRGRPRDPAGERDRP